MISRTPRFFILFLLSNFVVNSKVSANSRFRRDTEPTLNDNNEQMPATTGSTGSAGGSSNVVPGNCSEAPSASAIRQAFEEYRVVPDTTSTAPEELARVKYPTFQACLGTVVNPLQVAVRPSVSWSAEPDAYYTVAMLGDEPRILSSILTKKVQHWLVGNIPGGDISAGEVLSQYLPSLPPSGPYIYTILVYKQPGKLTFNEIRIPYVTTINLLSFSIEEFAKKYNMGAPVAGNFFVAKFPDIPVVSNIVNPILGPKNPL